MSMPSLLGGRSGEISSLGLVPGPVSLECLKSVLSL
jgi:hypothetical protein